MPTVRQVQAHQSVVGAHDGLVDLQVCRATTERLHVDPPFLWVEVEGLQGSRLACEFHRVNVLVSSVVSCPGISFGVLVRHGRAEGIEDGAGGDVLGRNEDNGLSLTFDFFFLQFRERASVSAMLHDACMHTACVCVHLLLGRTYHYLGDLGIRLDQGLLEHLRISSIVSRLHGHGGVVGLLSLTSL